jgi:hypothetical protein
MALLLSLLARGSLVMIASVRAQINAIGRRAEPG